MAEFYLRHTVYTKIEADSVDEAREVSHNITEGLRGCIQQAEGTTLLEINTQKDWELRAQNPSASILAKQPFSTRESTH